MKKHLGTALTTVAMIAGLALLGFLARSWWQSRLPGRYDVMSYGAVDDGGAQPVAHHHFSVAGLTGPKGKPDYKVTLTAEKAPVQLASGQDVNAWTFNGSAPGPELRIRQGDLVQITLANKDIRDGVKPGAVDAALPQPPACGRRPDDAPHVCRRDDPVQSRKVSAERPRVATRTAWRSPALPRSSPRVPSTRDT